MLNLEEPEDGAELGGGAVRAFSELVGVRRGRLAELQGDFFHQCRIAVFLIKPTFLSSPKRPGGVWCKAVATAKLR